MNHTTYSKCIIAVLTLGMLCTGSSSFANDNSSSINGVTNEINSSVIAPIRQFFNTGSRSTRDGKIAGTAVGGTLLGVGIVRKLSSKKPTINISEQQGLGDWQQKEKFGKTDLYGEDDAMRNIFGEEDASSGGLRIKPRLVFHNEDESESEAADAAIAEADSAQTAQGSVGDLTATSEAARGAQAGGKALAGEANAEGAAGAAAQAAIDGGTGIGADTAEGGVEAGVEAGSEAAGAAAEGEM